MRVLVENGMPHLENMGDVAMLQVTVRRLQEAHPEAEVHVLTERPERLAELLPGTRPLLRSDRDAWTRTRCIPLPRRLLPGRITRLCTDLDDRMRQHAPRTVRTRLNWAVGESSRGGRRFFDFVASCDAVVCCGGGLLNDWFPSTAIGILSTMQLAQSLGKPTAMFGLGVNKVENARLRKLMREVLPRLNGLGVREQVFAPAFLEEFGVAKEKIVVTGDDAIDLAVRQSGRVQGRRIGVNIRVARHTELDAEDVSRLCSALEILQQETGATYRVLPVMVRDRTGERLSDERTTREILANRCKLEEVQVRCPEDLAARTAECRLVISVSYHTCVFGLATGVPTLAIAKSAYYRQKHEGLSRCFENRGLVASPNDNAFDTRILQAARSGWSADEGMRTRLRECARQQVAASRGLHSAFWAALRPSGAAMAAFL